MGMFDDLIPGGKSNAKPKGGMFDDLIPQGGEGQPKPKILPVDGAPKNDAERQFAQDLVSSEDRKLLASRDLGPGYAAVSSFGNSMGLNIPRNAVAGIHALQSGRPFDEEYQTVKAIDDAAARQYPKTTAAAGVAGSLVPMAALPGVPAASAGARALIGGATGAGMMGAAELADSKDPEKALQQAAIGGAIGGVAAPVLEKAITAPVNAVGRVFAKKPSIPTTDELKQASQAAYGASENAGVVVKPQGIRDITDKIKTDLAQEAYHPKNQPKLTNFLSELDSLSIGGAVPGAQNIGVTLKGLDKTRKMLNAARSSGDAEEKRMASIAADSFDEYLANLKPSDISAGNMQEGVKALKEARSLWSSYRKADLVDEAMQRAELRASKKGSGGNIDNDLRDEMFKLLDNKRTKGIWTDQERAALAKAIKSNNTLRLLGKLSPQGNGLMASIHILGAGASGGSTIPLAGLGAGAKYLADNATKKNVERLSQLIRARGMNIDPQELVQQVGKDRLRNFFSSIGINVDKMLESEATN